MSRDEAYTIVIQALARGYCAKGQTDKVVDPALIEAMAEEIMLILPLNYP